MAAIEELLQQIETIPADRRAFELWVPVTLTLNHRPVAGQVAMAILLDALLARGFFPDGFAEGEGGRLYKYRME